MFVKVALMDGTAMLFVPAPQTAYDDSRPIERVFIPSPPQAVEEQVIETRLAREIGFDPDVWIVEIEDRARAALPRSGENLTPIPAMCCGCRFAYPAERWSADCVDVARARWRSSS